MTKGASQGNIHPCPKTNGFRNDLDRKNHEVHIAEMGFKNPVEYEQAAIHFVNNGDGEIYKIKNKYYKFNPTTTEFACVGEDGNLVTYYYAKDGNKGLARKYVDNFIKKNGGRKI